MSNKVRIRLALLWSLALPLVSCAAENNAKPTLDQQFQAAVTQFHASQFAPAAAQLEALLPQVPKSFEVHELLGLVYAAQSRNEKAVEQLEIATQLKPGFAAARTNLAAALVHSGKLSLAGEQFRKALALEPKSFDANHNLGEFYIQTGEIAEAMPLLQQAQRLNPSSYDNSYDLATACSVTGHLDQARELVEHLLQQKNVGELHTLLGQIDEKDGKFVPAANEFETAAHLDPSEENLFNWGSEYLLHRTYEPAIEVFQQASQRYPASPRLLIGLGMALYSHGRYDESIKALLAAADLNPSDPRCYLFLSKASNSSPGQANEVTERFERFAALEPDNGLAVYYYAMSLWKGLRAQGADADPKPIIALLQKAVALDPKLSQVHVQLGNLLADQHDYAGSIPQYQQALGLDSNLPDAHYRLGQDYVHLGQKEKAQAEFDIYQKLRAQHLAEVDKERAEVQQFVYAAKTPAPAKP